MMTATHTGIACRLAYPDEGPLVKALFTKYYQEPCDWLNFSNPFPHWIIAEQNGEPVGIAMLGVGNPFGWIEFLMVDHDVSQSTKGRIVSTIEDYAYDAMKAFGVSGVISTVSDDNQNFRKIVERRGFVPQGTGTIYLKRL